MLPLPLPLPLPLLLLMLLPLNCSLLPLTHPLLFLLFFVLLLLLYLVCLRSQPPIRAFPRLSCRGFFSVDLSSYSPAFLLSCSSDRSNPHVFSQRLFLLPPSLFLAMQASQAAITDLFTYTMFIYHKHKVKS